MCKTGCASLKAKKVDELTVIVFFFLSRFFVSSLIICSGHMALFLFGLRGLVFRCKMRLTLLDTLQSTMLVLVFLKFYFPRLYFCASIGSLFRNKVVTFIFRKPTLKWRQFASPPSTVLLGFWENFGKILLSVFFFCFSILSIDTMEKYFGNSLEDIKNKVMIKHSFPLFPAGENTVFWWVQYALSGELSDWHHESWAGFIERFVSSKTISFKHFFHNLIVVLLEEFKFPFLTMRTWEFLFHPFLFF